MIKFQFFQLINIKQWWILENNISLAVQSIFMQLVQPTLAMFYCAPYMLATFRYI